MVGKNRAEKRGLPGLSLWALLARGSFYKVLAVALLMAVAEVPLFYRTLRGDWIAGFEIKIEESHIHLVFLAALGAVYFLLIRMNRVLDNEGRYTAMRLQLSQGSIFWIRTAYDVFCLLMLFAVQAGLALCFAESYRRTPGMPQGSQTVFLAFYRNDFLHGVLPMADLGKWVRGGLMLLAMGMDEAGGIGKRYRTTQVSVFLMSAAWFAVPAGVTWQDTVCCFVYVVVIGVDLLELYRCCRSRERMEVCMGNMGNRT
ncbi:MAG: hypothetical protein HFH93_07500 [Lachnospiraceae bacterium]|nr:hypothetical protein [Lachnospiraceae bacterium]